MDKMNEKNILDIRNLSVQFASDGKVVKAVNNVSLKMKKGETLGLVGETGAGKTTIAKAILQILPSPPAKITGGEIYFEEENILKLPEKKMRTIKGNKISMIFQDPMTALNPIMTVGKQIAEAIGLHSDFSRAKTESEAVRILEMVGIPGERFSEYPHQFSGGMKQRVVIAMALACKPELLLADEPTTALDVTIQAQVLDMMNQLKKDLGTSMILITHDLGVVFEMCEKVAVIYSGEIVEYGTAEDIFDRTAHPYTIGLFQSLPSLESKEKRLKPIKGMMPDPAQLPEGCKFCDRCPKATDACKQKKDRLTHLGGEHYILCDRIKEAESCP